MTEVILHIYDVTNTGSEKTNNTILHINKIFKDAIGLGGIFHSAVQVYTEDEWSFGFCEQGTGMFRCPAGTNQMYTYRESVVLGRTDCSIFMVNQILQELGREWPGHTYNVLSRNCNHFCDNFCERLGVPKLPGWVNRFAHVGDTAVEIAGTTDLKLRQAKSVIVSASKVAYRFLPGVASNSSANSPTPFGGSGRESPRFQSTWLKNRMSVGAKPSNSSDIENQDGGVLHQQRLAAESPPWQTSRQDL